MDISIFLYIACFLLVALLSTRLMKIIKLPNVTGFILTGILMGPFVFGLLFNNFTYENIDESTIYKFVSSLSWVSQVALGFIAFSIGTSFKKQTIQSVGKRVVVITILEALGASILVIGALFALYAIFPDKIKIEVVLTLSAIAAATAPAATLMVIKQYRAEGPLVNTLLPVVALDDAAALILFAIFFQMATSLAGGGEFNFYAMLIKPLIEIVISIAIGAVLGLVIVFMNKFFKSRNNRLVIVIFAIFASLGLYFLFKNPWLGGFELSSLLMCMMAGAIYANLREDSYRTFDVLDRFTSPIFMFFFVLSGASLDLRVFFNEQGLLVLGIAAVYIVFRVLGKWGGSYTGASITHCEPQVKKYLGFALFPQAGVAIGLATNASKLFGENPVTQESGALIMAIILTSTLIYELIGPLTAKFALSKAGEIKEE